MGRSKTRKFETIEEILQAYLPDYVPGRSSSEADGVSPPDTRTAVELAQRLLDKFKKEVRGDAGRQANPAPKS
jgi:hypothetical protein